MTPATLDEFIANPNFGIKLLTSLQEEREARKALELQSAQQQKVISELEPKATHYDQWINGTGYYSLNTVAKLLGTGRNRLIKQLKTLGFLTKERVPYQRHMGNGNHTYVTSHNPTEHLCFHDLISNYPLVLNMRVNGLTDVIILVDICVPRCV